jgi:hypothetical protein
MPCGTVCRILSLDGELLGQVTVAANATETKLDLDAQKPDLYIISLEGNVKKQSQKVQKL